MNDESAPEQGALFTKSVGEQLREAREAQKLTLADVADRTRVPIRHLEAIEDGRYDAIPSPTYAIGFARSYARAVGLDDKAIANAVRQSPNLPLANTTDYSVYEPTDPKRLPSRGLATVAAIIALVVVVGVVVYYGTGLIRGSGSTPADAPTASTTIATEPSPTPAPTPVGGGQVSLVATDTVWLRVYDANGKTLLMKELKAGERYDVPADADHPMINTAKPEKLQITVNGSAVPPLGDGKRALKDVPISAAALLSRGTAAASPAPVPSVTPLARRTAAPVERTTPDMATAPADIPAPAPSATP
ncbi:MAG: helix-turn-helix domain-containing protein [Sphingomonas sp.]|uniref:helix-turn-helix domain-containing protein n=1 Tax=Sphingomonas sp. TaxID=28214 RepID=UPI001AD24111|nr:helix-turn-helix domain-containing protein [Sphingomonas sp.]MBN8808982.1 helix-turn-helix domain-containing protein [Sphingomonas sp.]